MSNQLRLSESVIKTALSNLDWPLLEQHLDQVAFDAEAFEEVLGHATRHSEWINKYPNPKADAARAKFLKSFEEHVGRKLVAIDALQVSELADLLALIERGYRTIVSAIGFADIGKKEPEVRAWAAFTLACTGYHEVQLLMRKALKTVGRVDAIHGIRPRDASGNEFFMEAVVDGLSSVVRLTLLMEAFKNKWFNPQGEVVLPATPEIEAEVEAQAGDTQALAAMWGHWTNVERQRRFLGGTLRQFEGESLPPGVKKQCEWVATYEPDPASEARIYDFLANHRLSHRLGQTFVELSLMAAPSIKLVGIESGAKLPPLEWISMIEAHAVVALSELLGYPIVDDFDDTSGLRLLEWVRGFSVLQHLAATRTEDAKSGTDYVLIVEEAELIRILQACGLEGEAAQRFISLTCLHRHSRDLFDTPIVRVGHDRLAIFTPTLVTVHIPVAVVSSISTRGKQIARKGKAFEKSVAETLTRHGFAPKSFKFYREGEEYEIDVVFVFDTHIVLLECKNDTLSGMEPSEAYYFDLAIPGQARQVKRLAAALENNPDVVSQHLGAEHVGKPIVPCVLHSLPYARLGTVDGVFFTDFSALGRFFNERRFHVVVPHVVDKVRIMHRTAVFDTWNADKPSVGALLKQLENPFQLELLLRHCERKTFDFFVGPKTHVRTQQLIIHPMTDESVAEAMGVDPTQVGRQISTMTRLVKKARRKIKKKKKGR